MKLSLSFFLQEIVLNYCSRRSTICGLILPNGSSIGARPKSGEEEDMRDPHIPLSGITQVGLVATLIMFVFYLTTGSWFP